MIKPLILECPCGCGVCAAHDGSKIAKEAAGNAVNQACKGNIPRDLIERLSDDL